MSWQNSEVTPIFLDVIKLVYYTGNIKLKDNTVSTFDAKTHLSQLLQEVEKGQSITITRRGKPIARLVPVQQEADLSVDQIAADLEAIRDSVKGTYDVKNLIREGRKY